MQKSVLSLGNIEGQYTCMHFKRACDMFLTKCYQHISDMTAVTGLKKNSQVQFPYNLTKCLHSCQWENQQCSVPYNVDHPTQVSREVNMYDDHLSVSGLISSTNNQNTKLLKEW